MVASISITLPPQDDVLKAVGEGIQAFAMVECALTFVYASLMKPADTHLCFTTLEAARNLETKLRIVAAVGRQKLSGEDAQVFTALINRIGRRAQLRHKLAHWSVSYWPRAHTREEIMNWRVALTPPIHLEMHDPVMDGKIPPIHLNQIQEFCAKCNTLIKDLFNFSLKIDSITQNGQE
ncbi:MAG: hypothetical protein QJR07_07420 [Acetobacteraceae bacterium]|nr:hypothetical protein [Acetobacteraceae bacterium]